MNCESPAGEELEGVTNRPLSRSSSDRFSSRSQPATALLDEPCLFGLYTLVALWFSELPERDRAEPLVAWTGSVKKTLTFSDAITLVRRQVWRIWVLESPGHALAFQKLNPRQKGSLLKILTQAL